TVAAKDVQSARETTRAEDSRMQRAALDAGPAYGAGLRYISAPCRAILRSNLLLSCSLSLSKEDASDDEAAAINAPGGGMVPREAPTFAGTGWSPSDLVFRPEWHLSQRPRAGLADGKLFRTFWSLVEVQKAFKALRADEEAMGIWSQTGLADFWRAIRLRVPLATSCRAWRGLPATEVVWRPFANAPVPASAARAHFLFGRRVLLLAVYRHMWYLGERVSLQHNSGDRLIPKDPPGSMLALDEELARLYVEARGDVVCRSWADFVHRKGSYDDFLRRLAPPVRFVLPEEEVDPEDVPHADMIIRYENSDGEEDPSTPGTELDQDLERLWRRNRGKAPVVDITVGDNSD
ncbi:hypothetical protein SOVF_059680, partial [Spinacia oleracea]